MFPEKSNMSELQECLELFNVKANSNKFKKIKKE